MISTAYVVLSTHNWPFRNQKMLHILGIIPSTSVSDILILNSTGQMTKQSDEPVVFFPLSKGTRLNSIYNSKIYGKALIPVPRFIYIERIK